MPEIPTFQDLYDLARGEVQARAPSLTDWTEGSHLDALTGSAAVLADTALAESLQHFRDQFVDTAEGEALDALAQDRFGMTRLPASRPVGTLRFTRSGDVAGAIAIPDDTSVHGYVGTTYIGFQTTEEATISAEETFVDVPAEGQVTGPDFNVAAGVIDTIDAVLDDPGMTVTQADRMAGGAPAESDAAFRDRIRAYFQTLRRGTAEALRTGALSVAGVTMAAVDESTVPIEEGGYVSVYIGDPDGAGNDALAARVETELENWRAAGVMVRVFSAEREEIALALTLTVRRGTDRSALGASCRDAILSYFRSLDASGVHHASRLEAILHALDPVGILAVTQTTPSNRALAPSSAYNALRVLPAAVSLTWVEV